jgi:hypothetical protein
MIKKIIRVIRTLNDATAQGREAPEDDRGQSRLGHSLAA